MNIQDYLDRADAKCPCPSTFTAPGSAIPSSSTSSSSSSSSSSGNPSPSQSSSSSNPLSYPSPFPSTLPHPLNPRSHSCPRPHPSLTTPPLSSFPSSFVSPLSHSPPGLTPSWSSVGGYDHPQPGSRLLQYGKSVKLRHIIFYHVFSLLCYEVSLSFTFCMPNKVFCCDQMNIHLIIYHFYFCIYPNFIFYFYLLAMGWLPDKTLNPSTIYSNHLMSLKEETIGKLQI